MARTEGSEWLSHAMGSLPGTKMSGRQWPGSEGQEARNETGLMSNRPGVRV